MWARTVGGVLIQIMSEREGAALTSDDGAVVLKIALPLPVDVASTVTAAVGAVYPNASVSFGSEYCIHIPASDRQAPVPPVVSADQVEKSFADPPQTQLCLESGLQRCSDSDGRAGVELEFSVGQQVAVATVLSLASALDADAGCNYVEYSVMAPEDSGVTPGRYTVTLARPGGLSAAELRLVEQQRAQAFEAQLLAAGIQPDPSFPVPPGVGLT